MLWDRRKRKKTVNDTQSEGLCLKQDFQNCLWNFSSSNTTEVTDSAHLTVLDRRKRQITVNHI